jgi:hypothetical protein
MNLFTCLICAMLIAACTEAPKSDAVDGRPTLIEQASTESDSVARTWRIPADTAGIATFWRSFQRGLATDRREEIIGMLRYPTYPLDFALFHYSIDCDEDRLSREAGSPYVSIDSSNALEHYDFMFSRDLKRIIGTITIDELMREDSVEHKERGHYSIFAREHMRVKCANDKSLKILVVRESGRWKVAFIGCC